LKSSYVIVYVENAGYETMIETDTARQGLSTRESRLLSRLAAQNTQIVTIDELEHELDGSRRSAREVASRLTEKGWLDRLAPGQYLIVPLAAGEEALYTTHEYLIAAQLISPMYIGYYSALAHHSLTEQVPRTVYVVSPNRAPNREIHGVPYHIVTVTERKFFGCEPVSIENTTVHVADREKTLVDCADHPAYCGGIRELTTAMAAADQQGCAWETVSTYLQRLGNGAAMKRIVYLADHLDIELPDRAALVESFTAGYSPLDPTQADKGRYDTQYRLRINNDPATFGPMES
jgi:predicted transcriptional regulator of viral defense system